MYNEELKRKYIEMKEKEVVLSKSYLSTMFARTTKFEIDLQKDVCNFSFYEIENFYKMIGYSSLPKLNTMNSQLSMYTKWCITEGLVEDGQNHFEEFSSMMLKDYLCKAKIEMKIVDRKTILSWCDKLQNPRDRFIILALFEYGKSKNYIDIVDAKAENIHGHLLELPSGRTVLLSDKLLKVAEDSSNATQAKTFTGDIYNLVDDGTIIKHYNRNRDYQNTDNTYRKGRRLYMQLTKILNYLDADIISANDIVNSGILFFVLNESKKMGIKPMDYFHQENMLDACNQYGINPKNMYSFFNNFKTTYADYLE